MYLKLVDYLVNNNILYDYQFGFRQHYSTSHALISLVDKISKALDKGELLVGVFLDLSKAFDTVNHDILIKKLAKYGIKGNVLKWFQCYLSNRKQYVIYDNSVSSISDIVCGVPQGSILGPLLFLLYINDIKNVSNILFPIIYADDTNIFIQGNCIDDLILEMNRELVKLNNWFQSNKLSLNVKKTHFMVFHRSRRKFNRTEDIIINNNVIEEKNSTTFLGVIMDSGLTWEDHVNYIKNKVSKAIGIINKVKHCINRSNLISLYNSFIIIIISLFAHNRNCLGLVQ